MRRLLLAICIGFGLPPTAAADELADKIAALTNTPDYAHSRWGILIVDAATGQPLYERNADQFFLPASTTKLFSCSAALHYLGPDYQFQTCVYRRGTVEQGALNGDLILVASGDLTLGGRTLPNGTMAFTNRDHTYADPTSVDSAVTPTDPLAGLRDLARQVKAGGIDRITGQVLVDDRLFDQGRATGSGPNRVTPIIVNDNVIDVIVTPGEAVDQPAKAKLRPELPGAKLETRVRTGAANAAANVTASRANLVILVDGVIPHGSKSLVRIVPIENPSSFAQTAFAHCLSEANVSVPTVGKLESGLPARESYSERDRVAVFTSPPLSEAIKVTLKVSHNLYASTLPFLVAAKHGERTLASGLRRQGEYLKLIGVDGNSFSFGGGAGGANADSTTPRATVQLLIGLAKRPEWPAIEAGLPILGVDGTLFEMVPERSPVRGHVRAKTGTLWWDDLANGRSLLRSKALAGVITTAKDRKLLFAIFVNDVPLPAGVTPTREGQLLGKICEVVYLNAG